ncbi:HDOD domain-containing protein, partial [Cognatilysobacter lacus]
ALRRDDRDINSLPTLLMRDPTLAGAVVRVANSAHYRRGPQVTSLPKAIAVLGNDGLRYVVLTSVMRPILQSDPSQHAARSSERLTFQAEARTWICGALTRGDGDAGEAQLASVVASTGVAALMRMMPRTLLAQASADPTFAPRFFALASALSARAAAQWRLDDALRDALHSMSLASEDAGPLARTLGLADRLSMLHALRVAGLVDEVARVSAGAEGHRRDAQLLRDLQAMEQEPAEA